MLLSFEPLVSHICEGWVHTHSTNQLHNFMHRVNVPFHVLHGAKGEATPLVDGAESALVPGAVPGHAQLQTELLRRRADGPEDTGTFKEHEFKEYARSPSFSRFRLNHVLLLRGGDLIMKRITY